MKNREKNIINILHFSLLNSKKGYTFAARNSEKKMLMRIV